MTNHARLRNKVAIITGAGAGIGAATSLLFCAEGAAVAMVDADREALERTAQAIRAQVPDARILARHADVRDAALAQQVVSECVLQWDRLDVLVNNAAMRNYSAAAEASAEEWQAIVAVNLVGMSNYCAAALPSIRESGAGSIVNVSSCYAVTGRRGMALYDATKAAQLAFTRSLAFEEAPHAVRVNAICPGSTLTDFHLERALTAGKSAEQLRTERKDTSLIGRWANPIEIARPILWMASDEASFITGTTLLVDGGLHIM
ncbi:SDR family oxidoreductase [Variovorax dokdonensis]|uniref:SDR family oxidoreductase n=1 Tax=Variovorax dokdonensis TaxID=344883 RepID=A0ABT7NEV1_9BURK|nr:SDR family oxidoreductase [Variovorax dokdonensis]MDM0046473.1 SDR family oxidoreductase [Variovorax dokdonensis]